MKKGQPIGSPFYLFLSKTVKSKIIFLPAVVFSIISFILLTMPGSDIPKSSLFEILYFDKWVHIGMFGLLTILWGYPFFRINEDTVKLFYKITGLIILYGIAMEFVQKYLADQRSFDVFDIIADSVGSILSCCWLIRRTKKKKLI